MFQEWVWNVAAKNHTTLTMRHLENHITFESESYRLERTDKKKSSDYPLLKEENQNDTAYYEYIKHNFKNQHQVAFFPIFI
jgi:hypothetical protein